MTPGSKPPQTPGRNDHFGATKLLRMSKKEHTIAQIPAILRRVQYQLFLGAESRMSEIEDKSDIPALVAPFAGSMTAVYGWYPNES